MNFLTQIIRHQLHCYKTMLLVAFLFLSHIGQSVATSGYETDLRSQTAEDNYRYDATGNLLQDKQEEIKRIDWTLSGKIAAVERVAGSQKPDLRFEYDALGNRTAKYLTPKRTDGTPNAALCMATFYVRDAQGNIMATYTKQGDAATQLDEQPIYGSSRLGVFRGSAATEGIVRGTRVYEASNHLGNVLLTFSDKKVAQPDGSYKADVTSASDYYAFGMTALGREFKGEGYRFGFNGKENDKELSWQDYGMREYDPRIGKFISVDPLYRKYPMLSTYQFSSDNPISGVDLDGLEYFYAANGKFIGVGDPNKLEAKVVLTKSTAEEIKKMPSENINERFKNGYPKDIISLPTSDIMQKAESMYKSEYEQAMAVGVCDGKLTSSSIRTDNDKSSVNTIPSFRELEAQGVTTLFDIHTHPTEDGTISYNPSGGNGNERKDIQIQGSLESYGRVQEASWILGWDKTTTIKTSQTGQTSSYTNNDKKITFYTSQGKVGEVLDFKDFKKGVEKANKDFSKKVESKK